MQKYRPKTIFAEVSDRLLRVCTASLLGVSWFIWLWGLSLPALSAGLALGALLWLCARQFSKRATQKREQQMRRLIGGELALERLLLESPRKAAFRCVLWLAPRYPLVMEQTLDWGVSGQLDGRKALICLIAQHPSQPVQVQQIVECAREVLKQRVEQTLLCTTAPFTKEAADYAAGLDPPWKIIHRQELIHLAGCASPATDDDLRQIGRQKRPRHSPKEWLAVVLDASRARRYFWYGLGLSAFALLTGSSFYPVPAVLCLVLFSGCKLREMALKRHRHWKA